MNSSNVEEYFLEPIGRLFYIVCPFRTAFSKVTEIPNYVDNAIPYLCMLFLLEICISMYLRRPDIRFNDTVVCLSHGIFFELFAFFAPGGQLLTYNYVYKNWRLIDMPWNSLWIWFFCFLAFDFIYYVGHRAVHEINILWAFHVVHHSSEDYNISTNVRQSILQYFYLWVFSLPVALFVPPSIFFVHAQLSYIYQFWIHTALIKSLGPLEYVLNTPSHHRAHHARNPRYIDKNFGGTLIIWDRIFGTFEPETEKAHFGVTKTINTFDLFKIQFDYCIEIWQKFLNQKGIINKLSSLIKGPGWSPGKPWHGKFEGKPDIKEPVQKYDVKIPFWFKLYITWHFLIIVQLFMVIMDAYYELPGIVCNGALIFQVFSLFSIGAILEKRIHFPKIELLRCFFHFIFDYIFLQTTKFSLTLIESVWFPESWIHVTYIASFFFWLTFCILEIPLMEQKFRGFTIQKNFKAI